ncbi:MAG: TonB-dependent receptor [Cocleimonas sp.]|nr:TonB-dependent receptor [Cocleimonas sp.]
MFLTPPTTLHLSSYLCVFSLLLASQYANAETVLEEIIVTTGTKTERKLLDVPVRTEVVSKQELERTHARDLAEGLKNVPGLLLKPIHGKSGQEVWLQGLDADRVLVLIDGQPVSASTGSSVDLSQIAIGDVDHIEIVKGAVSALYGSEAMGGVVNIITSRSDKPFSYSFVLDTGTYGDKNIGNNFNDKHIKVDLTRHTKNWHVRLTADIRDKQGTDLDKSTWRYEGHMGTKSNLSTEIAYTSDSGTKFAIKPTFYIEDLSRNFSTFVPGVGEVKKVKREDANRKNISLTFNKPLANGGKLSSWFIHENFRDITQQDTLITPVLDQKRDANMAFNKAEIQWDRPIGENHLFTVGLVGLKSALKQHQTQNKGGKTVYIDEIGGKKKRTNAEIYLQDDIFITDKLELLPGFRYQNDSDFGSHSAPKINLMYTPNWSSHFDTKLRFGLGKGYRVPTLKDRYFIFDHSALGYMVIGDANLQPETSTSFTVGIELAKASKFNADFNVFYNDIDKLIGNDLASVRADGVSLYKNVNIDKARTQGFDISTRYTFSPRLSSTLSYSYLNAIDVNTKKKLTQRPVHQVKLKLNFKLPKYKADISLYGNHQSKEYINSKNTITSPGYSTLDLKLNKEISKGTKLFFGIDNITDIHRDVPPTGHDFRPTSGRFIYTGIRFDG